MLLPPCSHHYRFLSVSITILIIRTTTITQSATPRVVALAMR